MNKGLLALILAAGKGTRFKSDTIKVLHPLMGKTMLHLVVETIQKLNPDQVHVVVGYQRERVKKQPFSPHVQFVVQEEQLGTAHAVQAVQEVLEEKKDKDLLIINADLPLLRPETLQLLLNQHRNDRNSLTFLTTESNRPGGFGRVIRTEDNLLRVVEEKEATLSQKKRKEINVGVYVVRIRDLLQALPKISNRNRKGEYYLTDMIEIMSREKKRVNFYRTPQVDEVVGVNDRSELARAVDILRWRKVQSLYEKGVTLYDPSSTWIDLDVEIGVDSVLYNSVVIEGNSAIGKSCTFYPFVHMVDTRVGNDVKILTSTVIEGSTIHDHAQVGPFTHLRPQTVIREGAKVGNFVEMKKTVFGKKSKAGHLSYLGDSEIEEEVNIGAGTITCNYDGIKKHRTHIGKGAFIGSGTELVAPVKVGRGSYLGAGSTITKDVSSDSLAVARGRQVEKSGWAKRKKEKEKKNKE
ncbi:bifunctional UDP-N-acetylglucosamine diphosphorylase/glucosamine-1-phosphate N-acetyltransferase GlmU [bacterium]|nr:bifunctional UDP-N-acetylglucosamine diphosphorylase/glucosamine-1-phosphate N-acetyltransferase GlmU [bacterium]